MFVLFVMFVLLCCCVVALWCCVALRCVALRCVVLCCVVLCCVVLCCVVLCCVLCCVVLCCVVLCCVVCCVMCVALSVVLCAVCTVCWFCVLCIVYCVLCTVYRALRTAHCVLCTLFYVLCLRRFFQWLEQISSVKQGPDRASTARSRRARRAELRLLQRPAQAPAQDTTVVTHDRCSRRRCFSCSADLKAPSVPPRAIAVAHCPSTMRTPIIQRSRPPGLNTTTSMRASFTLHAGFRCVLGIVVCVLV